MVVAGGTGGNGTDTPAVRFSDPKSSSFIIAADMLGPGPPTFFAAAMGGFVAGTVIEGKDCGIYQGR